MGADSPSAGSSISHSPPPLLPADSCSVCLTHGDLVMTSSLCFRFKPFGADVHWGKQGPTGKAEDGEAQA